MSEVKTQKTKTTTKRPSRKKAVVKTPEVSLMDAVVKTMEESNVNVPKFKVADSINVKMMFPKLRGETDEQYIKRFPHRAHSGDIGFDVVATEVEYDLWEDTYIYHTGIYCETEEGDGCFLMPRSCNAKTEAYLCNGVGLVETFMYRGEFCLKFKNRTSLHSRISDTAVRVWLNMPWYKKLFSSYNKVWWELKESYEDNALSYAPYEKGNKVAQIVWMKFPVNVNIEIVDELTPTERGMGGFGSTGE